MYLMNEINLSFLRVSLEFRDISGLNSFELVRP